MTTRKAATRGCAILLALTICWRVLGAPVDLTEWRALETPLWQAKTLLPSRMARALRCWPAVANANTTPENALLTLLPAANAQAEQNIRVYLDGAGLLDMPLEQYVLGVVAAEMPASYHLEALKAQAVAARTRAVSQLLSGGCARHEGADICGDSAHCQGYSTYSECAARWAGETESYLARVTRAVEETRGAILTYEEQPITVCYHAISGGRTEDAQTVFSQALPYLISVESAGEEGARGFITETLMTRSEAAARLLERFPDCGATMENLDEHLKIYKYAPSGRVNTLLLGGREIKATELRSALGLRSTWFSMRFTDTEVIFEQRGYGHGVGMSQAGANAMASGGSDYQSILLHYYPETVFMDAGAMIN